MGPLPPVGDLSAAVAVEAVRRDKKIVRGTLHFVMPVAIGRTEIVDDVTERELLSALREIGLRE
jgi:3-dehydroquinate synthase